MQKKILLIDDEAEIREQFTRTLERAGYQVNLAEDGQQGWEEYQKCYYDVVIIDWKMPKKNGLELLEQIDNTIPRPHSIMITAFGDEQTAIDAHHRHAFDYLKKPVDMNDLLASVNKAIERKDCIIAALEAWVEANPQQATESDMATFSAQGQTWSAKDILQEIRCNTPRGQQEYQNLIKLTVDLLTRGIIKQ